MSLWAIGLLLIVSQNSGAYAKDEPKPTIGEQLDVIIKDVSYYLLWLFGYDEESAEDQIDVSEMLAEEFRKDVDEMLYLMHEEADKHMKHAKDLRKTDNDKDIKDSKEKVNSEVEKSSKEKSSEDTSETEEKEKRGSNMAVIPI